MIASLPDWLQPTFVLLPAALWLFLGVGLPWALAALPRHDWRHWPTVGAVALALGPAFATAGLFFLGTLGRFTAAGVLAVSVGVAALGVLFAVHNRSPREPLPGASAPLSIIDLTLLGVTVVAVLLRFWNTAYWPFATYDEFWVYGFNARVFTLRESIPASIGYYPQLVPLSYTFMQILWGGLNDHAARTVVPFFALGSIAMTYLLGERLFNRRVGLLVAAFWALYPHNGVWSQFGDLEVPVTLYFTGTAAFFILGWREKQPRYVILSGLLMGAALWTKPTAGALVESVGIVLVVAAWQRLMPLTFAGAKRSAVSEATRVSPSLPAERGPGGEVNRFSSPTRVVSLVVVLWKLTTTRYPLLALLVAAPMGGLWYVRNVLAGHPPLVFPAGYWQSAAQRSGQELGWPLLIALALVILLFVSAPLRRRSALMALGALALLAVGSLPSAYGGRLPTGSELSQMLVGQIADSIKPAPLGLLEFGLIALGVALLIRSALPFWRSLSTGRRATFALLLAFIGPYFVTWFRSYSYHFRLSFAIVPCLLVILAALIDRIGCRLAARWPAAGLPRRVVPAALIVLIFVLALPGWIAILSGLAPAISGALPTDDLKMAYGNRALMQTVFYLRQSRADSGLTARPLRIMAPGEQRLPFFFPLDDVRTEEFPIWLDQVTDVDYYIDSSLGRWQYMIRGQLFLNQIVASRTRQPTMQRRFSVDDGNFRLTVYTIHNAERFKPPQPSEPVSAQIGDFACLAGIDLSATQAMPGESVNLTLWWQALGMADLEYSVYLHLWDAANRRLIAGWDGQPLSQTQKYEPWAGADKDFLLPYSTRLWQKGETIRDAWRLDVPPDAPPGLYELRVGLYEPVGNNRLPVTKDGVSLGDGLKLGDFRVLPK
jgi:hypothetical protein